MTTGNFLISRAGEDKLRAQQIAQILEEANYETFLQDWDILPGHSFPDQIPKVSGPARISSP